MYCKTRVVLFSSVSKRRQLCRCALDLDSLSFRYKSTESSNLGVESEKTDATAKLDDYKKRKIDQVLKNSLARVKQPTTRLVPEKKTDASAKLNDYKKGKTDKFSKHSLARVKQPTTRFVHEKKTSREKALHTFAPEFEAKIRNWKKLLTFELEAEKDKVKSMDGGRILANAQFTFKSSYYSIAGRMLELNFSSKLSNDDFFKISSFCRKGMPLQLFINRKEAAEQTSNDPAPLPDDSQEPIETVAMEITKDIMRLKLKDEQLRLDEDQKKFAFFKLNISDDKMPLKNLIQLISNRKEWLDYPGYKLLLYAYRAKQLPISTGCRKHKLPKEFNPEQCEAIMAALNVDRPITAIHGPPGTGKTKVIAEIIAEMVNQKNKVLVCAPSHKAVFNVLKCCHEKGLQGYCKIHGEDKSFTKNINYLVENHLLGKQLNNVYDQMNQSDEQNSEEGLLDLHKQSKLIQRNIRQSIAEDIRVLFCTVASISVRQFFDLGFNPDLVILDEAGQSMECESWPMIFQAQRVVVVGDHNQLPAVVSSEEAKKGGLDVSLLEWISKNFGPDVNFSLDIQHRFNSAIQSWPNKEFYKGRLKAHPSVANICLRDIFADDAADSQNISEIPLVDDPLVLVDTDLICAEDFPELSQLYDVQFSALTFADMLLRPSSYNIGEALICAQHLKALLTRLSPAQVGCITPYFAQMHKIKSFLPPELASQIEISTVDAFQGQEREAIVMSLVRNNKEKLLGFLTEFRRLNVAVTRAKRQFLLVGSSRMLRSNAVLNRLLETIQCEGKIISPSDILLPVKRVKQADQNMDSEKIAVKL